MEPNLTEVKVEGKTKGKVPSRRNEFVYVNSSFVESATNVNSTGRNVSENRTPAPPVTGVYREQYWACSRWPHTQRVLAVAVGILLGALIGCVISIFIRDENDTAVIGPILLPRHSVPN